MIRPLPFPRALHRSLHSPSGRVEPKRGEGQSETFERPIFHSVNEPLPGRYRVRPLPQAGEVAGMMILLVAVMLLSKPVSADDIAYRTALAKSVRASANRVLPSIVTVEIIGTGGPNNGEVEQDAPTSGVIIDSAGHILASSIVVRLQLRWPLLRCHWWSVCRVDRASSQHILPIERYARGFIIVRQ